LESGDVPGAIQKLELATKLEPNSPQNHIALSQAYAKAGRAEDAKRERERFLALRKEIDAVSKPQ
jgi:Flp pilus assembly protein TadD